MVLATVALGFPLHTMVAQAETPTAAQLAEDLRFRTQFGLRHDSDYIKQLYGQTASQASRRWGVRLTQAEADNLAFRGRIEQAISELPTGGTRRSTPPPSAFRRYITNA